MSGFGVFCILGSSACLDKTPLHSRWNLMQSCHLTECACFPLLLRACELPQSGSSCPNLHRGIKVPLLKDPGYFLHDSHTSKQLKVKTF